MFTRQIPEHTIKKNKKTKIKKAKQNMACEVVIFLLLAYILAQNIVIFQPKKTKKQKNKKNKKTKKQKNKKHKKHKNNKDTKLIRRSVIYTIIDTTIQTTCISVVNKIAIRVVIYHTCINC